MLGRQARTQLSPNTVIKRKRALIAKMEALKLQVLAIESRCKHDWNYEADPSGNNDTGYFCRACGSFTRSLKR